MIVIAVTEVKPLTLLPGFYLASPPPRPGRHAVGGFFRSGGPDPTEL
jgi:hypothetical protein